MPRLAFLLVLILAAPSFAQKEFGFDNRKGSGQPYLTPAETVKRMKVAPEFEVKLFAGEPDCINPIAFTIDEKGRIWVVECFEYPSRTPKGKAPRDRIVILEDTDGDGVCDKRTVFAEGKDFPVSDERKKEGLGAFDLASGVEVGNGGVYVGAPPYLWFIENKDDKPGKFERILSGFGSQDTHETLNTFQWGPDGWLYGMHGIFTQSTVKPLDGPELRMNAAVWRLHPKTKKFEIFAEGTSNPWGMDWRNSDGQFILACCVIPHLYHMVPGGVYKRQAGSSTNPYVYSHIQEICDHTFHKESGWAHAGLISLDAPHIPEKYRNSVIFGSIHGCSIKQNILKPNGSSYAATRGEDFLVSGDKNFRPINMKWGPNGDIYLIDWHDQMPCHQAKADEWDYERGRVYRIQLKDRKGGKAVDLGKKTLSELQSLTGRDDPYQARTALRLLSEQADNALAKGRPGDKDTFTHLAGIEARGFAISDFALKTPRPDQMAPERRAFFVRVISERFDGKSVTLEQLEEIAANEKHAVVRRELASTAIRHAEKHEVSGLLHAMMQHQEDHNDPLIPNLLWVGYEKALGRKDGSVKRAVVEKEMPYLIKEASKNQLIRDQILPKVMRRLVAAGSSEDLNWCLKFLVEVTDTVTREKALDGLTQALEGQTVDAPDTWAKLQPELRKDAKLTGYVNKLSVNFRDPEALKRAVAALKTGRELDARLTGLREVIQLRHPDSANILAGLLRDSKEPLALRQEAARQIPTIADPKLGANIVRDWATFPATLHADLASALASRKESAKLLLSAMAAKKIERTVVTDNTILKMLAFNDRELNDLIEKAWGRVRKTPDELNKLIDKTRAGLVGNPASFTRGKAVFEAQCAKCHKFDGKGVEVGPNLDGAARDIEYMLANVIDPNRVIGAPYFLRTANTLDGQAIQGILAEETEQFITLKVENAKLVKLAKKDLDGPVKVQEKSMMPEGLTAGMTEQNFRDLLRYVMANPYITDVKVGDKTLSVGVTGRIPLPDTKGEITIASEFTSSAAFKTRLLVGAAGKFTVLLDGKEIGGGNGVGTRTAPDTESIAVEIPKGTHQLTIRLTPKGKDDAVFLRFLDPDRRLSYPEGK